MLHHGREFAAPGSMSLLGQGHGPSVIRLGDLEAKLDVGEVSEGRQRGNQGRRILAPGGLLQGDYPFIKGFGLLVLVGHIKHIGQAGEGVAEFDVLGPRDFFLDRQGLAEQGFGVRVAILLVVERGQTLEDSAQSG